MTNPVDKLKRLLEIAYTTGQDDAINAATLKNINSFDSFWDAQTAPDLMDGVISLEQMIQERVEAETPAAEPHTTFDLMLNGKRTKFLLHDLSFDNHGVTINLVDAKSYWARHSSGSSGPWP